MEENTEVVSALAVCAANDVRVVFGRLRRRLKDLASSDDLSPSQASVLTRLYKTGLASASELAVAEGVRPQSMATTVAALSQRGLIQRATDPQDGRRRLLTLTPAGRQRAEGDRQARQEWLARAMQDRYTEPERQLIIDAMALLDRLTQP